MALARIARANFRKSRGAYGSYASEKDLFKVGGYTRIQDTTSHVNFNSDGKFSYVPTIKEHNFVNFAMRGISGTPYYQFPSANSQTVVEESELELENDQGRYAGLDATKPGEKPRVVVLGTGWAACRFLKGLDTKIYDVVCISPRNHMVFTPLLASTCVGTLEFRTVAEPVTRIQDALAKEPNSFFFLASCTGIDTGKHEVYCEAVNNGGLPREPYEFKVAYDKLVIAAGAEALTFGIKGVAENAFFLRDVNHAQEIRKRLLLNLMLSENPGISEEEKKRLLHCVVIGGGPTGVEFSGELSDFITRDVHERYTHVKDYIHVTLIEANEILSSFDVSLRQYATKHLTKSGVHLKRGVVKEVHSKEIILSDGTKVPYGLLVWSTGVGPSEFVKALNLPKSPGGRIGVDEWLRVPSVEDVFALGDCAGFLEQTGRPVLPALAQVAEREGKFLVELFNKIGKQNGGKAFSAKGMPLGEPFVYKHIGSMASVGGYKALVDLRETKDAKGLSLAGFVSWMIWRSAYLTRVLSWRNRLYVAVNWATTLVFGRDNSRIG
ncbi:internal alternative NAD(P)H-ubiquinone oxidoreductase A2, mitochondrial-like [Vigna unguiculata]|uniref:NADH:ubiquinone reductase (non-electrogenic) n=1 Tax=Vigna unguiculata TaxID=3917 RepID=A0A4D6L710_VIGUN|nr:internal alternative NAD(P)H-ubiquinone oxidoreductase A2, mitochondrial-like [Vigna unguiculata]XP_027918805.1 internal alternative NAD(P)H-ubiquinone oxidoreductase A2, mitochondrial-like [Vigna unguiculata]QCD84298.1 NADH dehydrogenase [Vigna unguiculata]